MIRFLLFILALAFLIAYFGRWIYVYWSKLNKEHDKALAKKQEQLEAKEN